MGNSYGGRLFDHHAQLLADSAISVEVAAARGYVTVDTKTRLDPTGIAKAARTVPGLLIPIYDTAGTLRLHQYRPDRPRLNEAGKPIKYETTAGRGLVIDVPPPARERLTDPETPLWITEGARKADSAVSQGLCCVALLGVWGWRGSNGQGGKTALSCWESIPLNGRDVFVCFDSDIMTKEGVRQACDRLGRFLAGRGARVRLVYLPDGDSGQKVGLDDYLAAGEAVEVLVDTSKPWGEVKSSSTKDVVRPPAPEPTPEVDGGDLLDRVETFVRRFCALPSQAAYVAMTLWAAHTHAVDSAESTPRIAFLSPEPASGKTRALEVLDLLAPNPMHAVNATTAAMFRAVAGNRPTILFDEIDTVFGPKARENEEMRGLLNAGHRRSGVAYRCVGEGSQQEVVAFPAYAALALAGLGDLPDTILSRSIVIPMRRRAPSEPIESFRMRTAGPEGHALRDQLAGWCAAVAGALAAAYPEMPAGVADRPADVWEPLLAIADAAGGDWPKRAREACTAIVAEGQDREPSLRLRLLADLRDAFGDRDRMATTAIVAALHDIEEAPWSDLRGKPIEARGLARMLRAYEVKSTKVKIDGKAVQGYRREDLHDPWVRYLPSPPAGSPEPAEPAEPEQETRSSDTLFDGSGQPEPDGPVPEPGPLPEPHPEPLGTAAEQEKQATGSGGSVGSAPAAREDPGTCCGQHGSTGGPLVPACSLCSRSPTFWRRS